MQKIFITSSGTGIGKTLVTCALAKAFKNQKKKVHALKPVISGFNENVVPNDLFYICEAIGANYLNSVDKVCFAKYKMPLSPDMAARNSDDPEINFKQLKEFCEGKKHEKKDYLLIETVGGIGVPLNSKKNTLDLLNSIDAKVVMVAGSYLGSLSHTITSYKLMESIGKKPNLLIISQNYTKSNPLYIPLNQTIKSLENFISTPMIGVEKIAGAESAKINKLSQILLDEAIPDIIG